MLFLHKVYHDNMYYNVFTKVKYRLDIENNKQHTVHQLGVSSILVQIVYGWNIEMIIRTVFVVSGALDCWAFWSFGLQTSLFFNIQNCFPFLLIKT